MVVMSKSIGLSRPLLTVHRHRPRAPVGEKSSNRQHCRCQGMSLVLFSCSDANPLKTVADVIRTCLGPKAMLKMILDPMGGIL